MLVILTMLCLLTRLILLCVFLFVARHKLQNQVPPSAFVNIIPIPELQWLSVFYALTIMTSLYFRVPFPRLFYGQNQMMRQ
ncbi:hypothetical protein CW304_29520 [Bacillus sp. UFRGS-B20]|nr:hypothetical protein CW304_29520 [Bacillus sp. UFRGS-B20]